MLPACSYQVVQRCLWDFDAHLGKLPSCIVIPWIDHYLFYRAMDDPKQYALVIEWKWAALEDSDQFWKALTELSKQRWDKPVQESSLDMKWENKDGSRVSIRYTQQGTRWIVTSDQNTFDLVRSVFK